jgi:endonuclease/exonuclease/phosphatase family metal-dependent hydrolase
MSIKLITLNIWGGHVHEPLLQFIEAHQDIDIFCLQEVYDQASHKISRDDRVVYLTIFAELQALLPNHVGFFRPVVNDMYGIAMFVKKTLTMINEGESTIHTNSNFSGMGPEHSRNLHYATFSHNHKIYTVLNVHGLWNGKGKADSPERIAQSQKIRDFMDSIDTPKIVCGDFNLRPDTKSLAMIANGMTDLIKTYDIHSTRTSFYPKAEKYADYIFSSPEIKIIHFAVLPDEVSDHSPLLLEFN